MKAFYLEIYPVLDVKLDETEAERFPLLWNYLFDEVINQYLLGWLDSYVDFITIIEFTIVQHQKSIRNTNPSRICNSEFAGPGGDLDGCRLPHGCS